MMRKVSSVRLSIVCAFAAGLAMPASALQAQDAAEPIVEVGPELDRFSYELGDLVISAQMPCAEPSPGPIATEGVQTNVCFDGETVFVFALSQGASARSEGPLSSDFDVAFEEVSSSPDTSSVSESEIDGRRVMEATRGPDPLFGTLRAVQVAPNAVAFAVTIANPNREEPISDAQRAVMYAFSNSLEVTAQ